ncbi:MAG TPA: class I lanthipeptide [Thermoanaerobaculia bacterium]|nr:class I lanthipeptide [Thermoanaerobaculia bacterium]
MKKPMKKLILTKETLRNLEESKLQDVAGAGTYTCGYSCGPLQCPTAPNSKYC